MNRPEEDHAVGGGGAGGSTKEEILPTADLEPIRPIRDDIVEAFDILKGLDKAVCKHELMIRKRYSKHFPELATIVQDNILYAKAVKLIGRRPNAANLDFSEILSVKVETELKEAAITSIGTEVSDLDLININILCAKVLSLSENRAQHCKDLKRMLYNIAPNLTTLVGEDLCARLIVRAGSLLNLAKLPASSIQNLGLEKALKWGLKTKQGTPKYGLINCSSFIGEALPEPKGPAARSLAPKISLAVRCDAFGDKQDNSLGLAIRCKLQLRLSNLKGKPRNKDQKKGSGALITFAKTEVEVEKDEEMVPQVDPAVDEKKDAEDTVGVIEKKKRKRVSVMEAQEMRKKIKHDTEPEDEKED